MKSNAKTVSLDTMIDKHIGKRGSELKSEVEILNSSKSAKQKPDLSKFRKVIFWDTDIHKIDWTKNKRAVIERVFERGDKTEQQEVITFYGQDEVDYYLNEYKKYLADIQR